MLIYFFAVAIFASGLLIVLTADNLIKQIIGLGIFQSAVLIFYIALSKIKGGIIPIDIPGNHVFSTPLPHVLMLTAIVVGFATMSVALALILKIYKKYHSILASEIPND